MDADDVVVGMRPLGRLARFSAMKAAQSGAGAAQAEFLPKVYLGTIAAGGTTTVSGSGLPTLGQMSIYLDL